MVYLFFITFFDVLKLGSSQAQAHIYNYKKKKMKGKKNVWLACDVQYQPIYITFKRERASALSYTLHEVQKSPAATSDLTFEAINSPKHFFRYK